MFARRIILDIVRISFCWLTMRCYKMCGWKGVKFCLLGRKDYGNMGIVLGNNGVDNM